MKITSFGLVILMLFGMSASSESVRKREEEDLEDEAQNIPTKEVRRRRVELQQVSPGVCSWRENPNSGACFLSFLCALQCKAMGPNYGGECRAGPHFFNKCYCNGPCVLLTPPPPPPPPPTALPVKRPPAKRPPRPDPIEPSPDDEPPEDDYAPEKKKPKPKPSKGKWGEDDESLDTGDGEEDQPKPKPSKGKGGEDDESLDMGDGEEDQPKPKKKKKPIEGDVAPASGPHDDQQEEKKPKRKKAPEDEFN